MAHCAFFRLPKDDKQKSAWIKLINRVDELPLDTAVCEDHFKEKCFDPSCEMKRKLLKDSNSKIISNKCPLKA